MALQLLTPCRLGVIPGRRFTEALKVARRIAIKSGKSHNFRRALDRAYADEGIKSKSGSTPFTQLAKYLFPGRNSTTINRYASVLAVTEEKGWSSSELRARLDAESITSVASRYKSKGASKDPKFDWDDVKRALHRYGSFRTGTKRKGWRVALVHFGDDGKASAYRLPVHVRPKAKALAIRACKAKIRVSPAR
jgi:hypothetical protein